MWQKKSLPPPVDYKIINLRSARFDSSLHCIDNIRYYNLEKPIIYILNVGETLSCYGNNYGWVCIQDLPNDDVRYLNSLLFQLVELYGLDNGRMHYLRKSYDDGYQSNEFFALDRDSKLFNFAGVPVMKTLRLLKTFDGKVALSIKGFRVIDDFHINLNVCVHQIKIEDEQDVYNTQIEDCIFE